MTKSKKVWVIHGRDVRLAHEVISFLRAIGLEPIGWEEARELTGVSSPYIGEILKNGFDYVQAFVVLLTGDDEAKLRDEYIKHSDLEYERKLTPQARPNVLFEAGMAFGRQPDKVLFVQQGNLRPFSDVSGMHILMLNNEPGTRKEFANRLKTAGCDISDLTADHGWLTVGNFEPPAQTQEKLREHQIAEIKVSAKKMLREKEINWDIERKSEPISIENAVGILTDLDGELCKCRSAIEGISDDSSTSTLDDVIKNIRALSRYKVNPDEGAFSKEFWRRGDKLLENTKHAIDYIKARP